MTKEAALLGIGIGLYRCLHEWPVWLAPFIPLAALPAPFLPSDVYFVIDAGKILGAVAFVAIAYGGRGQRTQRIFRHAPAAALVLGSLPPVASLLGVPANGIALAASLFVMGAGAGMLFCRWIEACGRMAPLRTMQALAFSYLVRLVVFAAVTSLGALAASAVFILIAATTTVQVDSWGGGLPHPKRQLPTASDARSFGGLFAWIAVFAFAYGMGTGATTLAHHPWVTGLGTATPMALILIASVALGERFSQRTLYAIALPLMTAGLVSLEFMDAAPSIAQFLISAAFDTFRLLAFLEVCSFAFRTGVSSMFLGAAVRLLCLTVDDGSAALMRLASPVWNQGLATLFVIMAAMVVGTMVYLPRVTGSDLAPNRTSSHDDARPEQTAGPNAAPPDLSRREKTVYALMAKGKTTAQISEELFISKGAVRSHASRIYEKMGVHSRDEFDDLAAR